MWPVSQRFLDSLSSTHEAVSRVRILPRAFGTDDIGFGTDCPNGLSLTVIDGDVKMTRSGDVKATLDITVDCPDQATWKRLRPLGSDLFVERGIDFGDGTQEWVPLGWYRIESIDQADAPWGPIKIAAQDRLAQLAQNKALYPVRLPELITDRQIFEKFVNGNPYGAGPSLAGSAAYFYIELPIIFTGYDPDVSTTPVPVYVQDDQYAYLKDKADNRNCCLRMAVTGELLVESVDAVAGVDATWPIFKGSGGNLVHASRTTTRKDTYNLVSSYSNSGSVSTGYQWASDDTSIVGQRGPFGPKILYFTSPILLTPDDAQAASAYFINTYGGLPVDVDLDVVPNPALRPNDLVPVDLGDGLGFVTRRIEDISIPLVGAGASQISVRILETS